MATVVAKLLGVVRPDLAFFGEKDYQQLKIVQRLVGDLDLGVGVIGCPTVREPDGLAMSSRNAYLSAEERSAALGIPDALEAAARALAWGERDVSELESAMRDAARQRGGETLSLEYAAVIDPDSLEQLTRVEGGARAIIAGRLGRTRLIDNCALAPPAE